MNPRNLMLLAGAVVVLAGASWLAIESRGAAVEGSLQETVLFPDLARRINDATRVVIEDAQGKTTLVRDDESWSVVEQHGYPAELERLKRVLIALTSLETVESKTSNPELYSRLGVEDPAGAESTSKRITVTDASGQTLAALVVGKEHDTKSFTGGGQFYARKDGEAQSWLVRGSLDLQPKPTDWVQKKILEVKRDRVRAVEVTHPDGEVVAVSRETREQNDYQLAAIPEGRALKYPTVCNPMASGLEYLNLEDVRPAGEVDFTAETGPTCVYRCFDGLTVTVTTKEQDGKTLARFVAGYEAPPVAAGPEPAPAEGGEEGAEATPPKAGETSAEEVQAEVAEMNARLAPWVYVIPVYNKNTFAKRLTDLLKDEAPPPPPPGEGGEGGGDDVYKIPSNLPPEIQEQIKADLESRGHKSEVVDPETPVPSPADGETPPEPKPDGGDPHDDHPHPH